MSHRCPSYWGSTVLRFSYAVCCRARATCRTSVAVRFCYTCYYYYYYYYYCICIIVVSSSLFLSISPEGCASWLWPYFIYIFMAFFYISKTRLFKYIENLISKNWKFSDKKLWFFHISAQNIDCGYSLEPPWRGGSNEYPQSMCLSRNKKNNVYPCKPQFYYIKVGFKGVKFI